MDADAIRLITFGAAFVIVLAYIWFVVWRIRIHRRRRGAEAGGPSSSTLSSDAMLRPDRSLVADPPDPLLGGSEPSDRSRPAGPSAAPASAPLQPAPGPEHTSDTAGQSPTARPQTVLEAVQGISLPHDLVPHPDATPRPGAIDRVALTGSMIQLETLQQGLADALGAIGYEIIWAGSEGMARNGNAELRVDVFTSPRLATFDGASAFPLAADGAVVVDFWLAAEG